MRRVSRILLYAVALLSAVPFTVITALWFRSYFVTDHFYFWAFHDERGTADQTAWRQDLIESRRGTIGMQRLVQRADRRQPDGQTYRQRIEQRFGGDPVHVSTPAGQAFRYGPLPENLRSSWAMFQYESWDATKRRGASQWIIRGPFWALALPLSAPPLLSGWLWRRRRKRNRAGRCPSCGYDLRATPDRCPECGTVRTQSDR